MKIKCFGWRNEKLDQISRIEKGLIENGHIITDDCPDIVYSNNDFYDDILNFASKQKFRPFIILNILDLQLDNPDYSLEKLTFQLKQADAVTCISETVKKEIVENLNIIPKVIYNPIKPVFYNPNIQKDIFSLFVGRARSPNKRVIELIKPLWFNLKKYYNDKAVHFVGPEDPNFGMWHGIVNDEELNNLYNRSLLGIISSKREGLNLPLIEMICSNCIPIVCEDMSTSQEFAPKELLCEANSEAIFYKMKEVIENLQYYVDICYRKSVIYKEQFSDRMVAKRIIDTYDKFKKQ